MSNITLSSNPSGTGTFTITSPNSNTNRTLTLPDQTGTILTTATAGIPISGPAFHTYFTGTTVNAITTTEMTTNSKTFDTATALSTSNGRFTPQVAGYYQINGSVSAGAASIGGLGVTIRKNGSSSVSDMFFGPGDTTSYKSASTSSLVFLNGTTDYVSIWAYSASGSFTGTGYFSGALLRSSV